MAPETCSCILSARWQFAFGGGTASGSLEGSMVASSVQSDNRKPEKKVLRTSPATTSKKSSILETLPAVSSELPPRREHSFQLLSWINFAFQNHPVWVSVWKAKGHIFLRRPSILSIKDSNTFQHDHNLTSQMQSFTSLPTPLPESCQKDPK